MKVSVRDSELLKGISERHAALSYKILVFYFLFALGIYLIQAVDSEVLPTWFRLFGFQIFLVVALVYLYRKAWRPRLELEVKPGLIFLIFLVFYFLFLAALNYFCSRYFEFQNESFFQGSTVSVFFLQILIAPVLEELFFRDYLTRSFYLGMKKWSQAILFSSAFFMLAHFSFYPGAFLLGLINALIFVGTRSVLPCIGFHVISNLSWYFLPALFPALFQALSEVGWLQIFFR